MSASRKAALPIVARHNRLLLYPSMHEGFAYSENAIYTVATLNQNTFALAEYLLTAYGPRILFIGAAYILPAVNPTGLCAILSRRRAAKLSASVIPISADEETRRSVISDIQRLKPNAIFSTIIGRSALKFYRMYAEAGIDRTTTPIASLAMAETEISEIGTDFEQDTFCQLPTSRRWNTAPLSPLVPKGAAAAFDLQTVVRGRTPSNKQPFKKLGVAI